VRNARAKARRRLRTRAFAVAIRHPLAENRIAYPEVTNVVWALRASRFRDCPELPDRVIRSIASKAANTRLAIRANYGVWKAWCVAQKKRRKPYPAAPGDLAAFLQAQAPAIGVTRGGEFKLDPRGLTADGSPAKSYSTLSRYLGTLSKLHRDGNQPDPTRDPEVLAVWRVLGRGLARPAQKAPLTFDIIRQALISLPDTPSGKRDRALLILAYTLMARRSELVALDVENFDLHADGSATVVFERQKTGEQGTNYLTPEVMAIVKRWLQAAQITTGPIFKRMDNARGLSAGRMTSQSVAGIFKRVAKRLALPELDPRRISSHSARIGATHDLVEAGAPDAAIMRDAGWKTTRMVGMYSRGAKAKKGAMASRLAQLAPTLMNDADAGRSKSSA
jgi:integrase